LPGALGVLLLLALLTWLLLRGIDTNAPAYAVTLRAFDDFALAEASLHRDVLQARAGLLRDYDALVKAVVAIGGRGHAASFLRADRGPRRGTGRPLKLEFPKCCAGPWPALNSARRLRAACARPTRYNCNTIIDS